MMLARFVNCSCNARRCVPLLLLLLMSFNSAALYGQGNLGDRRGRTDIQVEQRERQARQQTGGPRLNRSAVFMIEVEQRLIEGIDQTIAQLERLASRMERGSANRLNLLERVMNLHLEQAVYLRNEEERIYDTAWRQWDSGGRRGREPQINDRRSKARWNRVIAAARGINSEYPRNANAPLVMFNEGMALQYLGREEESARTFTQLIQRFPNSAVAGDAYASLGEFYFERNDFRNAMNNYQQAMRYRQSRRYLWSVFKMGWCSYNLGNYRDALNYWQNVVRLARASGQEQSMQLREEALRDMVFAFAELRMVEPAIRYFQQNGGSQYIGSLLVLLSETFADNGQYREAIMTLKRFQQLDPTNIAGPETQKEIINLAYELGQMQVVWSELRRFPQLYGPQSSWARANRENRESVLETQAMIRQELLHYAKLTHRRGIDTESERLSREARIGYLLYVQSYPRSREIAEVFFNLADIEFFLKDFQRSGQYSMRIVEMGRERAVVFDDEGKPQRNIHRQASRDMLQSYARAFEPEFNVLMRREPDFSKPAVQLSQRAANYLAACALYKKNYPDDEEINKTCDIDAAEVFFRAGHKERSQQLLRSIAMRYPKDEAGPRAVYRLIPLFAGNDKALLALADEFLKIPEYRSGELGRRLNELRRGAILTEIQSERDALVRAKRFEEQATNDPRAAGVERLWYNAGVDYLRGGDVASAIRAYLVLVQRFPNFERTKEALIEVARLYEKTLDFSTAANYYQQFAQRYQQDQSAGVALAKACELRLAIEASDAAATCLSYAGRHRDDSQDLIERLIIQAERKQQFSQMTQFITRNYLPVYRLGPNEKIIAHYRIYKASRGQGEAARQAARQIIAEHRNSRSVVGEALRYVGEMYFLDADAQRPRYTGVSLVGGTVERLAESIDRKANELARLKEGYDRVIATQDAYWGVASLYRLGEAYEQFAEMLKAPPAIQGAELADVVTQLAPQAEELAKSARESYQAAWNAIEEYRVYNDWSLLTLAAVKRMGGSHVQYEEAFIDPDFVGSEVSPTVISEL